MVAEIQSSGTNIVQSIENRNNQVDNRRVEQTNQINSSTPPSSSNVNLTEQATNLQALERSISAAPEVDQQRVDSVRQSINEGSFRVDAEQTATNLINFDTALPRTDSS